MSQKKEELSVEMKPIASKLSLAISILEEKVAREYGLTIEEVRSKVKIQIMNSKLIIK